MVAWIEPAVVNQQATIWLHISQLIRWRPQMADGFLHLKIDFFNAQGLASLSACQSLCENTTDCKGVEYHTSGRCEIWTRPGGIESSISFSAALS